MGRAIGVQEQMAKSGGGACQQPRVPGLAHISLRHEALMVPDGGETVRLLAVAAVG
jgi:hypothetical protein